MKVIFKPSHARGRAVAPPSKSMAHRYLICSALAEGESEISGIEMSKDISATLGGISALGARTELSGNRARISGGTTSTEARRVIDCGESGTTLRFLLPAALLFGGETEFLCRGRLSSRPNDVYRDICRDHGMSYRAEGESIIASGGLTSGEYTLPGDISSQFVSGLLLALPLCDGDSIIRINTKSVESRPYIDMTIDAMSRFGVNAEWSSSQTLAVRGGQRYAPQGLKIEGDWSNGAFLLGLAALGGEVEVDGLPTDSLQGDRICSKYLMQIGRGIPTLHISDTPDLGPLLFAVAAAKHGAIFTGSGRLRYKESDRIEAMREELSRFGTRLDERDGSVSVYPASFHAPTGECSSHGDHRIAMALALLLSLTGGTLTSAEAVDKSYPTFWQTLSALGVEMRFE